MDKNTSKVGSFPPVLVKKSDNQAVNVIFLPFFMGPVWNCRIRAVLFSCPLLSGQAAQCALRALWRDLSPISHLYRGRTFLKGWKNEKISFFFCLLDLTADKEVLASHRMYLGELQRAHAWTTVFFRWWNISLDISQTPSKELLLTPRKGEKVYS